MEEFISNIQTYSGQKQDGDWLKQITSAKSAVVSLAAYPAFNKTMNAFRFFAERAATRPQHREQALRASLLAASLACMALDAALERLSFEDPKTRYRLLYSGVTYGDAGDSRVKGSIDTVLSVISKGVKNGRVLARQTSDALDEMFAGVRAEIIAEFFSKEQNAALLFPAARELEARAHARNRSDLTALSVEAKSVIGVFADFVGAKRTALLSNDFVTAAPIPPPQKSPAREPSKPKVLPLGAPNSLEDVERTSLNPASASGQAATEPKKIGPESDPKLL